MRLYSATTPRSNCSPTISSRACPGSRATMRTSRRSRVRAPLQKLLSEERMADQLFANYINGEWVSGAKTFENRNPANTEELVGLFVKGSAADVAAAADAA